MKWRRRDETAADGLLTAASARDLSAAAARLGGHVEHGLVELSGVRLAYVPAGEFTLGWDPERPLQLTTQQRACTEEGSPAMLAGQLSLASSPLRTLQMEPS